MAGCAGWRQQRSCLELQNRAIEIAISRLTVKSRLHVHEVGQLAERQVYSAAIVACSHVAYVVRNPAMASSDSSPSASKDMPREAEAALLDCALVRPAVTVCRC